MIGPIKFHYQALAEKIFTIKRKDLTFVFTAKFCKYVENDFLRII